jgi:ubiquinone/menaquinone biosynthesis C-methylase UbiE
LRSREIRKHFLFKEKTMHGHLELPPRIARQRNTVHRQVERESKRSLSHIKARSILDVGTGYGMSVELLAKRFDTPPRIWSIDPSAQVLRRVRSGLKNRKYVARVKFSKARAEELPFRDGAFDLVVSLLSLHHLTNPEKGVREMGRVLSRGGRLVIADWRPAKSPVVPHKPKHIRSPTYVTQIIRRLGFSTSIHKGRYWYFIDAMKKW